MMPLSGTKAASATPEQDADSFSAGSDGNGENPRRKVQKFVAIASAASRTYLIG
jgi:hypothetical protein